MAGLHYGKVFSLISTRFVLTMSVGWRINPSVQSMETLGLVLSMYFQRCLEPLQSHKICLEPCL